jgi:predicted cobalt transporter CbtA
MGTIMTARSFLVRGLLAGLLAGFAAFLVSYQVGEPYVDRAIALEEAAAEAPAADAMGDAMADAMADDEGTVVSRGTQRTWGLLTGSLGIGLALGGLVALAAAAVVGRISRLSPGQSTALVTLVGFVAVTLVPFLKYPATPPAVGNPDTLNDRTISYFGFVLLSLALAVLASLVAARLRERVGSYAAVIAGVGSYVATMVIAGQVLPTVNELGAFPADILWGFRLSALLTLTTMWAVIGIILVGLVGRLQRESATTAARRELAASL